MKHSVVMVSSAMIYIPSFIKIGSGIQKLVVGIHRYTDKEKGDLITLVLFIFSK
jgi:hypothetical protein